LAHEFEIILTNAN